jgi:hypothetical protein
MFKTVQQNAIASPLAPPWDPSSVGYSSRSILGWTHYLSTMESLRQLPYDILSIIATMIKCDTLYVCSDPPVAAVAVIVVAQSGILWIACSYVQLPIQIQY